MSDIPTIRTAQLTKNNLKEIADKTKYSVRELALMLREANETNRTVTILLTPLSEIWESNDDYKGVHRG
jgi:hypothetical protein